MIQLFDANALIALCFTNHIHHKPTLAWLAGLNGFAVCPITEGSLVRYIVRSFPDGGGRLAEQTLTTLSAYAGYHFWPDNISYNSLVLSSLLGHGQVTDAYLAALAGSRGSSLATFDGALAATRSNTVLIPTI